MIEFSAQQIATLLGGKIIGDQNRKVSDVGPLESAREGQLSFLCEEKYLPQLETTNASVVLLSSGLRDAAEALPTRSTIIVVENFTLETPKTKDFIEIINNLKVDGKKSLFVLPGADKAVYLSARNLQRVNVMAAAALNTYKVLDADVLVLTEGAVEVVAQNLNK